MSSSSVPAQVTPVLTFLVFGVPPAIRSNNNIGFVVSRVTEDDLIHPNKLLLTSELHKSLGRLEYHMPLVSNKELATIVSNLAPFRGTCVGYYTTANENNESQYRTAFIDFKSQDAKSIATQVCEAQNRLANGGFKLLSVLHEIDAKAEDMRKALTRILGDLVTLPSELDFSGDVGVVFAHFLNTGVSVDAQYYAVHISDNTFTLLNNMDDNQWIKLWSQKPKVVACLDQFLVGETRQNMALAYRTVGATCKDAVVICVERVANTEPVHVDLGNMYISMAIDKLPHVTFNQNENQDILKSVLRNVKIVLDNEQNQTRRIYKDDNLFESCVKSFQADPAFKEAFHKALIK